MPLPLLALLPAIGGAIAKGAGVVGGALAKGGGAIASGIGSAGGAVAGGASKLGGVLANGATAAKTGIGTMMDKAIPYAKENVIPALKEFGKDTLQDMAKDMISNTVMPPQQQAYIQNILSQPQAPQRIGVIQPYRSSYRGY